MAHTAAPAATAPPINAFLKNELDMGMLLHDWPDNIPLHEFAWSRARGILYESIPDSRTLPGFYLKFSKSRDVGGARSMQYAAFRQMQKTVGNISRTFT